MVLVGVDGYNKVAGICDTERPGETWRILINLSGWVLEINGGTNSAASKYIIIYEIP